MFLSQGLNADETVLSVALVKPDTKLPHIYLFDTRYGMVAILQAFYDIECI